jgi:hypothetical protein
MKCKSVGLPLQIYIKFVENVMGYMEKSVHTSMESSISYESISPKK